MELAVKSNGDAERWRTLRTFIFVVGVAGAIFVAGMSYGKIANLDGALEKHIAQSDRDYLKKDGRELAEVKGELQMLNGKLDMIINNQRRGR